MDPRFLLVATGCLLLAGAEAHAAPRTDHYDVLIAGEKAGELTVAWESDADVVVDFAYSNNGRGPDLTERYTLDADRHIVAQQVTGTTMGGAPIDESYAWDSGVAEWRIGDRRTQLEYDQAPAFVATAASPWWIARTVKALIDQRRAIPAVPVGELHVERVQDVSLQSGDVRIAGRLYALSGHALRPAFAILDAEGEFVASISRDLVVAPAGSSALFAELSALESQADFTSLAALMDRVSRRYEGPIAIRNVQVFDSEDGATLANRTVVVHGDRIALVAPADTALPDDALIVDGDGGTLLPGLIDMHDHVDPWRGLMHLAAGVTSTRDLGNDNEFLLAMTSRVEREEVPAPRIFRAGLIEGRSAASARTGIVAETLEQAREAVHWYATHGYRQIKIYNSIPPDWLAPLAAEAHELGLRVSGHIPAFTTAEAAVRAGYDEINHINMLFLNFVLDAQQEDTRSLLRFTAVGERAAALDLDGPDVREFIELLEERKVTIDPTVTIFEWLFRSRPGRPLPGFATVIDHLPAAARAVLSAPSLNVDPALYATYDASFDQVLGLVKRLYDAGVPLVPGTDFYPGITLHRELELYREAGIPAQRVLQIATRDAARVLERSESLGRIAPGMLADLVLIAGDPTGDLGALRRTRLVLRDGRIYFPDALYRAVGVRPFAERARIAEPQQPVTRPGLRPSAEF